MRALFDIQHPAQVHLFKHAVWDLEEDGHETLVTSRDKEMTLELLDAYGIDHVPLSSRSDGLPSAVLELGLRELRTFRTARSFDPDVVVSRTSPPPVHAALPGDARSVVVADTALGSTLPGKAVQLVSLPLADVVCRPPGLDLPVTDRQERELALQELAYLHPDRFTPDADALASHGVDVDEPYFVLRLAGWDAYHDVGHRGISPETARELVSMLSEHGTVYVSSERELPESFGGKPIPVPTHLVHDLLYYADLYVGDSGTMSTEAAVLGTPAVRTNSAVGENDEHAFVELESEYGLLYSFANELAAVRKVRELLEDGPDGERWRRKRDRLIEDRRDPTDVLVEVLEEQASADE